MNALTDRIEEEAEAELRSLRTAVRAAVDQVRADPRSGKRAVNAAAEAVDSALAKAMEVARGEVGEKVRTQGDAPQPARRMGQLGFLRSVDKRKYESLVRTAAKVRSLRRRTPMGVGLGRMVATGGLLKELSAVEKECEEAGVSPDDAMPERGGGWWATLDGWTRSLRASIKGVLRAHDKHMRWKGMLKFQSLLRHSPKVAHRYIFEGDAHKPLDRVKTSDGVIISTAEGVVRAVEEY